MTVKGSELIGAEVIGVEQGVYVSLDKLHLRLTNGKFVRVAPLYEEGLFVDEVEGD